MSGDRPDARELVEAVAAWLAGDLAPALSGGPRFQALVAAQALGIAARELELGTAHGEADREAFGPSTRADLAASIRRGEHDDTLGELASVLRDHVRRKLDVARPGYMSADTPRL